jgi:hypothetical protein
MQMIEEPPRSSALRSSTQNRRWLVPPASPSRGTQRAYHPGCLGHIHRGYPRSGPLILTIVNLLPLPHTSLQRSTRRAARGAGKGARNTDRRAQGNSERPFRSARARLRDGLHAQANTGVSGQPCLRFSDTARRVARVMWA